MRLLERIDLQAVQLLLNHLWRWRLLIVLQNVIDMLCARLDIWRNFTLTTWLLLLLLLLILVLFLLVLVLLELLMLLLLLLL